MVWSQRRFKSEKNTVVISITNLIGLAVIVTLLKKETN